MGLYISFDLFNKKLTAEFVSEDGTQLIFPNDEEDVLGIEFGHLWKNYVARDVLKEFIAFDTGQHVIIAQDKLKSVVDALDTRQWDPWQTEDALIASAELSKILSLVDFDNEYLALFYSE